MRALILLALFTVGEVLLAALVVSIITLYDWLLDRRRADYRRRVDAAREAGYSEGEATRLAGRWAEVYEREPRRFNAAASRVDRRRVTVENCECAWASGFRRGFAAAERARFDAEADAMAIEASQDEIARIEAYANGERAR